MGFMVDKVDEDWVPVNLGLVFGRRVSSVVVIKTDYAKGPHHFFG